MFAQQILNRHLTKAVAQEENKSKIGKDHSDKKNEQTKIEVALSKLLEGLVK